MKCYTHPDSEAIGTCTNCGKPVCTLCAVEVNGKIVCRSCAEKASDPGKQPGIVAINRKEPFFALLLSLIGCLLGWIFPGLGQVYNGQIKKGISLIAINIVTLSLYVISLITIIGAICCLPILLIPLGVGLFAMYDAYTVADKINKGEVVRDWFD